MTRAVVAVLDSLGLGGAPDAEAYGDAGANTLGHIADARAAAGRRLAIPNLAALGLTRAGEASGGRALPIAAAATLTGAYGHACETSRGKDTPSGHWELMGVPVTRDWGYFPPAYPSVPDAIVSELIRLGDLPGILGNRAVSGTVVLEELGAEHVRTGKPIVYTSGDSVLQIAAHEDAFGLERLYALCRIARVLVDNWNIGRVIARPFATTADGRFERTGGRRDYAVPPPAPTLLDVASSAGRTVIGVGKIADIFAGRGVTQTIPAHGNDAVMDAVLDALDRAPDGALIMANFVDFDTLHGHRRDPAGYADAIEAFDRRLPELVGALRPGDLGVLTADHGNDPTWPGTDHTRECVPVFAFGPGVPARDLGRRDTFADVGASVAAHLRLPPLVHGRSFL